jgi:hypothetical protein
MVSHFSIFISQFFLNVDGEIPPRYSPSAFGRRLSGMGISFVDYCRRRYKVH